MTCLKFVDDSIELQVTFPWWDRADVRRLVRTSTGAPVGEADEPFDDIDQGWHMLIWRTATEVVVMQGVDDSFPIRFRVSVDRYLAEWAALAAALD